jgi:hypothetical protein
MRCIDVCGFESKPDSVYELIRHVESCSHVKDEDVITVFRNSEFVIVSEPEEGDHVMDNIVFRKFDVPAVTEDLVIVQPAELLAPESIEETV